MRYLDDRFITQGRSLVLIGPAGLGKTHLAVSIGLAMLKRGYTVRVITAQALLTRVLRAAGLDGRAKVLRPYIESDLLILDEFIMAASRATHARVYRHPRPMVGTLRTHHQSVDELLIAILSLV